MKHTVYTFVVSIFAISLQMATAQEAGLVTVLVTGTGVDVPAAKKDAYRSAVEQVVGKIEVNAESLVENDKVIQDSILMYSSAYVESAEVVGNPVASPDGLVRVRIKAVVRKKKLEDKLRVALGNSAAIEGEGLFAELVSRQEQWSDATAIIRSVFMDFPLKVMTIRVLENDRGRPALELDQKTGEVTVPVCIAVDMPRYNKAIREIREKIGPIAQKITKTAPKYGTEYESNDILGFTCRFLGTPNIHPKSEKRYLFICTNFQSRQGLFMELDLNHFTEIQKYFALSDDEREGKTNPVKTLVAEVSIYDLQGQIIRSGHIVVNASDDFRECHAYALGAHREPGIMIVPFPVVDSYSSGMSNDHLSLRIPSVPWKGYPPKKGFQLKGIELFAKVPLGAFLPEELRRAAKVESRLRLCGKDEVEEILREKRRKVSEGRTPQDAESDFASPSFDSFLAL